MRPLFRRAGLGALIALAIAGSAPAQDPPAPIDAEETLVDGLVVKAIKPGPAMWQVSDADSTVWVMGVPTALPKGIEWNKTELKSKLAKANVLIIGTGQWKGNLFSLILMALTGRDKFMAEGPLTQTLPPEMLARYQKAGGPRRGGAQASEVNIKPVFAAFGLSFDFQRTLDMQQREPERSIRREALFRVHTTEAGESNIVDFLKILQRMPRGTELACMEDALRQVEAGKDRALEAARGWARGDLRVAVTAQRGWERCIAKDPEIAKATEASMASVTAAIQKALEKPGRSVAIAELRPLLAQNGILVRLKAIPGVTVLTPDVPGLEEEDAPGGPSPIPSQQGL